MRGLRGVLGETGFCRWVRGRRSEVGVWEKYRRLSPVEHVLVRPEVYLGAIEAVSRAGWVVSHDGSGLVVVEGGVAVSPALAKVFDEIVVNAADNVGRAGGGASRMRKIAVSVDPQRACVHVENDGDVPPVVKHGIEGVWVPEMIFGTLLTGSNFGDVQDGGDRALQLAQGPTGGRHGYGAKLANIMSREFTVTIADKARNKLYRQTWTDNMRSVSPAQVTDLHGDVPGGLSVEFLIDVERFGIQSLQQTDIFRWMHRRVMDIAACLHDRGVDVSWNGELIKFSSFGQYARLHAGPDVDTALLDRLVELKLGQWDVCARCLSQRERLLSPPNVSFVNNIATYRGGTHVSVVEDQIVRHVIGLVDGATPALIRSHLLLFLRGSVLHPEFESQSKELLSIRSTELPSYILQIPKTKLKELCEASGLVNMVQDSVETKSASRVTRMINLANRKNLRSRVSIPKLEDAVLAGTPSSHECTLILTEGDSAKALAMAGLAVVGREKFGVFPLRGKVLNVRDISNRQIVENAEVMALIQILGLRLSEDYSGARPPLRYGRVMLMTDQDQDGSHIKGLVINLFDHLWPSLLRRNDFMYSFLTPIVKIFSRRSSDTPLEVFYDIEDFKKWRKSIPNISDFRVKYYKGLGTSTSREGKQYFEELNKHEVKFQWNGAGDSRALQLAFDKAKASDRRKWLTKPPSGKTKSSSPGGLMTYSEFVNEELIQFSRYDNERSIPSLVDGLKPSQRKVLYACFKRKLISGEIKVAQLAGYVAEHTAYHHGEASLHSTIIRMAQSFVGANNMALLEPLGQFGTRLLGGDDAASARYVYTRLSALARLLFPEDDHEVLTYRTDDGFSIEPEWYAPIIPLVLVNGCKGIGTGWSVDVPMYHPHDIIENIVCLMEGKTMSPMFPWARGFQGSFEMDNAGNWKSRGKIERISKEKLCILELPLYRWTEPYRSFLSSLLDSGKVRGFSEMHTDSTINFEITMEPKEIEDLCSSPSGLESFFRLQNSIPTKMMNLFDERGELRNYAGPLEILQAFYPVRLEVYHKRKNAKVVQLESQLKRHRNRLRFVDDVIRGSMQVSGVPLSIMLSTLHARGYDRLPSSDNSPVGQSGFKYLVDIPLWQLTSEKVSELRTATDTLSQSLEHVYRQSVEDLWRVDLEKLQGFLAHDESYRRVGPCRI